MNLPNDVFMALSIVNMKLRDTYASLDELCASEGIDRAVLESKLKQAGFTYDAQHNTFG
ncbi:MAG: DUF4250 domain-containing protein [Muribaculum sp.]|nr:DUF4250 domain-containing protein [Muribaculum sp.]